MKTILNLQLMLFFVFTALVSISAQQKVNVNGIAFKSDLEVATAQISHESISLVLYEIAKTNPKYETDNCTDCPDGKSLILDIDFKRGFKFPIKDTDSVFVRMSTLQENLGEYKHNTREIENAENAINQPEANQLKNNAEAIKVKGMEIAKLMQEGKITPQEAEKQLMALTQSFDEGFNNSSIADVTTEEYKESATYAFNFYNDETLTEAQTFSGYLYIIEFNEERFVAEYKGDIIEQCVEKRAASSIEEEQKCKSKPSQYLPETRVLNEGSGAVYIDINIKEFLSNR